MDTAVRESLGIALGGQGLCLGRPWVWAVNSGSCWPVNSHLPWGALHTSPSPLDAACSCPSPGPALKQACFNRKSNAI